MRRLRSGATLRDMLAETRLASDQLIAPLFVRSGEGVRRPVASMPGQFQFSVDTALESVRRLADLGIRAVLLFGIPDSKDPQGSAAWDTGAPVQRLMAEIKTALPEIVVIGDVCLCEYTDHGHCGPIETNRAGDVTVHNDAAAELLGRVAVSQAQAGADIVAPSAMMDGQVCAIRQALDQAGLFGTAILSYAVKFASALYGPFRDAAESAPGQGDRRSYQMDYRAGRQARIEAALDAEEGADMLMVKPAGAYLDIIATVRARTDLPLAAYQVSGEYAMIHAAAERGWMDLHPAAIETVTAIRRAGADLVITYFAEMLAQTLAAR